MSCSTRTVSTAANRRPLARPDTPVIGLIHLTQIFVREMKKQNSGVSVTPSEGLYISTLTLQTIINLGSIAGREAYAGGKFMSSHITPNVPPLTSRRHLLRYQSRRLVIQRLTPA